MDGHTELSYDGVVGRRDARQGKGPVEPPLIFIAQSIIGRWQVVQEQAAGTAGAGRGFDGGGLVPISLRYGHG